MSVAPNSPVFELALGPSDTISHPEKIFVPVPMHELGQRTTISLAELTFWAFYKVPKEFKQERQRIGEALSSMEQQPPTTLMVYGPDEGDCYIELPESEDQ